MEHRKEKRREAKLAKMTYHQVKHVFSIDVKQIRNIPVLTKFIREARDLQMATLGRAAVQEEDVDEEADFLASAYIQNVAIKYSFPLDEDEVLESDYIKRLAGESEAGPGASYDYGVSMNTVHAYHMPKEDSIEQLLTGSRALASTNAQSTNLFNLSLVLYQDNHEFVIGNAQLPMEDLADLVRDHDAKTRSFDRKSGRALLDRVIFLYGTSYSQRANCIIGKLALTISYQAQRQYLTKQEAKAYQKEQKLLKKGLRGPTSYANCFMQRETFINRKIPLNALLTVAVDRVTSLKESIENIEHFARVHMAGTTSIDGTQEPPTAS